MSPYLFVIVMEYLSRLMRKLPSEKLFKYHPKFKGIELSHLFFADDIIMVCKADKYSPLILKGLVDKFSVVSGLQVNFQKSHIFFLWC